MKSYKMKINGNEYEVAVKDFAGHQVEVEVNGKAYTVELVEAEKKATTTIHRAAPIPSPAPTATPTQTPAPQSSVGNASGVVRSPLPGVVLEIKVAVGSAVKRGDIILVLEAMKMENNIAADRDGTITAILVNKGDSILEGASLVTIG